MLYLFLDEQYACFYLNVFTLSSQVKGSHFSIVGAYNSARDMVLVMDISRFEYPSFWIPLELLWKAMSSIDKATGHHMGYMQILKMFPVYRIYYWLDLCIMLIWCVHCLRIEFCLVLYVLFSLSFLLMEIKSTIFAVCYLC